MVARRLWLGRRLARPRLWLGWRLASSRLRLRLGWRLWRRWLLALAPDPVGTASRLGLLIGSFPLLLSDIVNAPPKGAFIVWGVRFRRVDGSCAREDSLLRDREPAKLSTFS
jgi:hypothetical protein